mgnify:FL=1
MREKNGCNKYTTKTLIRQGFFPEGYEVCRYCPFCVADPSNKTREILAFADLVIDGRCPLIDE